MLQRFVSLSKLERFTLVDFDNASLHPAVKWWGAKEGGGKRKSSLSWTRTAGVSPCSNIKL